MKLRLKYVGGHQEPHEKDATVEESKKLLASGDYIIAGDAQPIQVVSKEKKIKKYEQ